MGTRYRGTFVISWAQVSIDGTPAGPGEPLAEGALWRWVGQATRLDGRGTALLLEGARGMADLRQRAGQVVQRRFGLARPAMADDSLPMFTDSFVVSDGERCFAVVPTDRGARRGELLMFPDGVPPASADLRIVSVSRPDAALRRVGKFSAGVICFTGGTRLDTPEGPRAVEALVPGDKVLTRDDGPQVVRWAGIRWMSGARLRALPELRPIRIRAGALGEERPSDDLLVSPQHRLLLGGRAAEALFNQPEVLVRAKDLINDHSVTIDHAVRATNYIHLLFDRHQIVWANGVETESFHPAEMALDAIEDGQREALLALYPELAGDPYSYGRFARRRLTQSEAALLLYERPLRH